MIVTKGFYVGIYKENGTSCSNGGISDFCNKAMIVSNIPELQIFDITPPSELKAPLIVIKRKMVCGKEYVYAEPVDAPNDGNIGWMMGGSFVYSCDSRFSEYFSKQPIPLHDRQETQKENDMYSR